MWSAAGQSRQLNSALAFFDMLNPDSDISDKFLERKFSHPAKAKKNISYEISDDQALLHQYHILRDERFTYNWKLNNYRAEKDIFDDRSYTAIAKIDRLCIGGCRFTYKTPNSPQLLPMEANNGFRLYELLPYTKLNNCIEISRLAIFPDYKHHNVLSGILNKTMEHVKESGGGIVFIQSSLASAREIAKIAASLGASLAVCKDIKVHKKEELFGERMFISMIDLSEIFRQRAEFEEEALA